jgi:hypothetical protein
VYFLVVAGALATAWRSGLLEHFTHGWTVLAVGVAVAMGVLLAILSRR